MDEATYFVDVANTRDQRMTWWRAARFGMFVHWGLYAQLGRHEWAMNRERIPIAEYEKLALTWKPKDHPAREWARLAAQAGMKYMVMTAKHHEGFCLWDTQQTDYNSVKHGPGRDLVREYVEACREFGLRIGFYYSLMDWHHPDGATCASDEAARRRFLDFTQGCVRELMTNYGVIDILWYDLPWPLKSPSLWESVQMNAMARELQPSIIINNRSQLDEDFGTPEEQVVADTAGRDWEACMTFNGSWGYMPSAPDWHSSRAVILMLRKCAAGCGNLLLNLGPKPDGSVPDEVFERLPQVGRWLERHGEALYGQLDRADGRMEWMPTGYWSLRGKVAYYWADKWPGKALVIGGLRVPVVRASLLATGKDLPFEQTADRLVLKELSDSNPDEIAAISVIKLQCAEPPSQELGAGCLVL